MTQSRLTMRLSAPEALRISEIVENIFEDEGFAISTFELPADPNGPAPDWTVDVYVPTDHAESALKKLNDRLGSDTLGLAIEVEHLGDDDWVAMSLEGLPPIRAGRFFVHGSHDIEKSKQGLISVKIDAGQAFGTGHHGTTAGCLLAIDQLLRRRKYASVFDLGTGTGLLAIAIAKATNTPVLASDIDPISIGVTAQNSSLNKKSNLVKPVCAEGLNHPQIRIHAPFDLVVANILALPLIQLAPDIVRNLKPGGNLILSGILSRQADKVTAAYVARGLKLERKSHLEGWATLTFRA